MRFKILRGWLCALAACGAPWLARAAVYDVEIDAARPRVASVTARLEPGERGLCMTRSAADTGLTHGWATFVHALAVAGPDGEPLAATYDGDGCWRVAQTGTVTARYAVLLQHDRFPNEPGDDELAYAGDWGQFWTGRALFLEGAPTDAVEVRFHLPAGWQATAPWPNATEPQSFRPANLAALLDSGFMLGLHRALQLEGTGAHIQLGLAGDGPMARADAITQILRSAIDAFSTLHESPPRGELAVFLAQGRLLGGGVMGHTISMLVEDELPDALLPMLAYLVTHEVFHLWNVQLDYTDAADFYWFTEGFAEYYSFLQLRAAGYWDDATLREQMQERDTQYRQAAGALSLQEAGQDKLDHYDLVYSGGLLAASALDALIRRKSDDRHRLSDVLPYLMQRYRRGTGEKLSIDKLVAAIRAATGVDVRAFFSRHIAGREPLPPPN